MDILQLKYLAAVVENEYNITLAAQKLHISQPALSKSITALEDEMNLQIFIRSRGRLTDLTATGQIIYAKAIALSRQYDELLEIVEFRSKALGGTFVVGVPPLVITMLFPNFFDDMKAEKPEIETSIIEYGGHKLEQCLLEDKLDFAVLLSPTRLNPNLFHEIPLHEGAFGAFLSESNPIAKKKKLLWSDLDNQDFMLCDETFHSYYLFMDQIEKEKVKLKSLVTAYSWDYIFASIRKSNKITFLPLMTKNVFNMAGMKVMQFDQPLPWNVILAYRKKDTYTPQETFAIDFFQRYFKRKPSTMSH